MSVKDESMDCDPTDDELEEQKLLMNTNYESLLNSEHLLNLNAKQVNLLKSLANGQQQLNLMKKENLDCLQSNNKLTKDDEHLLKKSIEQRFSPLSNKELNLQQASQKVILQHLQNKQHLKQNRKASDLSDQQLNSAPQSPSSVHSLQSTKSDLSAGKSNKFNKPSPSPRLNGSLPDKANENHRNEASTIENRSPIASPCSPIASPLLNNVNGLFNHLDSASLSQHLLSGQLQVPANHNSSSRTSSPSANHCNLDSELLSKLSAFQQLLNQQQSSPSGQPSAGSMNSLISNLMNRNGTTPQSAAPNSGQLSSMSTLNLLNNLINGNNNLNNLASSQNSTSNQPPVSSSPTAQSRNHLLNTLQKLNSLNNPNSSNSSFKDSSVNINNSNNSANSVSTVNSSSNGSKFNDSISNGPLSSPNNLNVAWPNSQTPPSMYPLVFPLYSIFIHNTDDFNRPTLFAISKQPPTVWSLWPTISTPA